MYFYSRNNFISDFFILFIVIFIFSISFSQEEPIHDILHLLRIRSLISNENLIFLAWSICICCNRSFYTKVAIF